jgi:predicted nucleotidyltransferase
MLVDILSDMENRSCTTNNGHQRYPIEANEALSTIVRSFKKILRGNLVGIYLHGSLAMGCFNRGTSDIDLLVVVNDPLEVKTKKDIIHSTFEIAKMTGIPDKGLEFSVILRTYLEKFVFPTPYELHYSKSWHKSYEDGKIDYTKTEKDPDLAAHITVTLNRGVTLFGKRIADIFHPIPEKYYVTSIMYDIQEGKKDILKDPGYYIFSLCRVLYYLEEKVVSSKTEAAKWALTKVPDRFKHVIENASLLYKGTRKKMDWENHELLNFTDYMIKRIDEKASAYGLKLPVITGQLDSF